MIIFRKWQNSGNQAEPLAIRQNSGDQAELGQSDRISGNEAVKRCGMSVMTLKEKAGKMTKDAKCMY